MRVDYVVPVEIDDEGHIVYIQDEGSAPADFWTNTRARIKVRKILRERLDEPIFNWDIAILITKMVFVPSDSVVRGSLLLPGGIRRGTQVSLTDRVADYRKILKALNEKDMFPSKATILNRL